MDGESGNNEADYFCRCNYGAVLSCAVDISTPEGRGGRSCIRLTVVKISFVLPLVRSLDIFPSANSFFLSRFVRADGNDIARVDDFFYARNTLGNEHVAMDKYRAGRWNAG